MLFFPPHAGLTAYKCLSNSPTVLTFRLLKLFPFLSKSMNTQAITGSQGGITCGAIDEPRESSKAIDEHVIINFCDKNVIIACFRDKNVVIARFRDKTAYVRGLRYR